jgi:hypothetical protein
MCIYYDSTLHNFPLIVFKYCLGTCLYILASNTGFYHLPLLIKLLIE